MAPIPAARPIPVRALDRPAGAIGARRSPPRTVTAEQHHPAIRRRRAVRLASRVLGVQVKTGGVDAAHPTARINIRAASFRPAPTTYFVVLAWRREENRFQEECLLIPSEDMRTLCQPGELDGHLKFDWLPGSVAESRLNPFRIPIQKMRVEIENRLRR